MLIVHDTGSEPGRTEAEAAVKDSARRGVQVQLQGRFRRPSASIWMGGELPGRLKLGWIMNNVLQLCARYAKQLTEGRVHVVVGSETEQPHITFPVGQLCVVVATPPGGVPPTLGSPEVSQLPWQGSGPISVDTESTYTILYRTAFVDLCSWDLLKVPGISPLPLEHIFGEIATARLMMYDLSIAGTQANWRKGAILEWLFVRGAPGDAWDSDVEEAAQGYEANSEGVDDEEVKAMSEVDPRSLLNIEVAAGESNHEPIAA